MQLCMHFPINNDSVDGHGQPIKRRLVCALELLQEPDSDRYRIVTGPSG